MSGFGYWSFLQQNRCCVLRYVVGRKSHQPGSARGDTVSASSCLLNLNRDDEALGWSLGQLGAVGHRRVRLDACYSEAASSLPVG